MRPLSYISVEVSRKCNLDCKHCMIDKLKATDLPTKDFFQFLDRNHDQFRNVTLTGGEPTLRKDLPQFTKGIHSYDKQVAMITNASTNPKRILKAKPDLVKISLDFSNNQHDVWRGKEGLAYHIIHKVIPTLQRNHIPLEILCTVTQKNLNEIEQMVHLGRELDVKITFQRYIPSSKSDALNLTQKQLFNLLNFIKEKREQGENISYYGGLGYFVSGKPNFCGAGLIKVHITNRGKITPCMFLLNKEYGSINNSFRKVRTNILNFRREYEKKVMQECGKCNLYPNYCAGDCIAIARVFKDEKGMCKRKSF